MVTVTVADYGLGNLFSITRALKHVGADVIITADPDTIARATHFVLPGVGAFGQGIDNLGERGLIEPIRELQRSGRPVLGICLGMQLLMTEGEEMGIYKGLDLIAGRVVRFPDPSHDGPSYKIPHVGWNELHMPHGVKSWNGTLLDGICDGDQVYFVHSYVVIPQDNENTLAQTSYGSLSYCSVIQRDNVLGCQFHPEKSAHVGLGILSNFIRI